MDPKVKGTEARYNFYPTRAMILDDSPANKTISTRRANRIKANRSPHEAFSHSPSDFDWKAITRRATNLPPNKTLMRKNSITPENERF